jgi:hypothetical protein
MREGENVAESRTLFCPRNYLAPTPSDLAGEVCGRQRPIPTTPTNAEMIGQTNGTHQSLAWGHDATTDWDKHHGPAWKWDDDWWTAETLERGSRWQGTDTRGWKRRPTGRALMPDCWCDGWFKWAERAVAGPLAGAFLFLLCFLSYFPNSCVQMNLNWLFELHTFKYQIKFPYEWSYIIFEIIITYLLLWLLAILQSSILFP